MEGRKKFEKSLVLYPKNKKFHNVYDPTIKLFSKRYNLKYYPPKLSRYYKIKNNHFLRKNYYRYINILRKLKKPWKNPKIQDLQIDPKKNLLFCFNKIPPEGYDFILDLEIVTGLGDYKYENLDKQKIKKRLGSDECKEIICWNKSSYISLTNVIDCSDFKQKIKIIPFAKKLTKIKKIPKKTFNMLFVSSINNPHDFETKGGLIALDAYVSLTKKYKNLKFYVRSNVPRRIRKKYRNIPGLIFLRKYLSDEKMLELFYRTDILFEPVPGINLMLECMDYGIPIVSFDYWCIKEMVFSGKSGYLINSSKLFGDINKTEDYLKNLKIGYAKLSQRKQYHELEIKLSKKAAELIENKNRLEKMSKYQRSLLEPKGIYSIEKRNEKLISIVDSKLQ